METMVYVKVKGSERINKHVIEVTDVLNARSEILKTLKIGARQLVSYRALREVNGIRNIYANNKKVKDKIPNLIGLSKGYKTNENQQRYEYFRKIFGNQFSR